MPRRRVSTSNVWRGWVRRVIVGGTKAGSTPTEAIMLLNRDLSVARRSDEARGGQLVSSAVFGGAWIGMLETGA
jgi:threonine aldolase